MLAHLISDKENAKKLLDIARLFLVLETPVLWDGKTEDELTGETYLNNLSFSLTEAENETFQNFATPFDKEYSLIYASIVDDFFLEKIKTLRLTRQNDPAARLSIAKEVVQEIVSGDFSSRVTWPFPDGSKESKKLSQKGMEINSRVILFELMKFSIKAEKISEHKKSLLKNLAEFQEIDDNYFDDLLAQALIMQKEFSKTINLILE